MPLTSERIRPEPARREGTAADLPRTVLHDLRHGGLHRTLRQELRDLYEFYLDDETRARLQRTGRFRRFILQTFWLFEQLVLRLSPARRILVLVALVLFFFNGVSFRHDRVDIQLQTSVLSFGILLVVLMLELKDKLLARQEIEVGRVVQLALLPDSNPSLPGWEFWLYTRPANDVGGDLVDYLFVRDDRLGLALGDVAGKGLGAALLMAKLQATLRAFAPDSESLAVLGARMNEIFCRDSPSTRFATLIYLETRASSGEVRLLNAGHPLPLVVRAQAVELMPATAPPLGILPGTGYVEQRVNLEPGDLLLVYSDGLTEARNRDDEFFGEERLLALATQLRGLPAEAVGTRLVAEVERFTGDQRWSDDLSLVLARRAIRAGESAPAG